MIWFIILKFIIVETSLSDRLTWDSEVASFQNIIEIFFVIEYFI